VVGLVVEVLGVRPGEAGREARRGRTFPATAVTATTVVTHHCALANAPAPRAVLESTFLGHIRYGIAVALPLSRQD